MRRLVVGKRKKAKDPYALIAEYYHLLFANWDEAVDHAAEILDGILAPLGVRSVLDCTCGIGLQCIGLAKRGYLVTGSDISKAMLKEARRNAKKTNASVHWRCADIRCLQNREGEAYDAVITCGNSLLHLLSEADLRQAVGNMHSVTRPGGYCLIVVGDYEKDPRKHPKVLWHQAAYENGKRITLLAPVEYSGQSILLNVFILRETDDGLRVTNYPLELRAPRRDELLHVLTQAGFCEIKDLSRPNSISLLAKREYNLGN